MTICRSVISVPAAHGGFSIRLCIDLISPLVGPLKQLFAVEDYMLSNVGSCERVARLWECSLIALLRRVVLLVYHLL